MKKILLLSVIILGAWFIQTSEAQVRARININMQPLWGPVGYDYVEYYFFPDLNIYYNVPLHRFIIFNRGHWVPVTTLPPRYRRVDFYRERKYVINEQNPFMHHDQYRSRFLRDRRPNNEMVIRDSRDSRYYEIKDHPMHDQWIRDHENRGARRNDYNRNQKQDQRRDRRQDHDR